MQHWHIGLLSVLILFPSCGRRQRTIFHFPQEKAIHLTTLQFPSPKIISLTDTSRGVLIQWLEPTLSEKMNDSKIVGYNIYRLTAHGFIPKKPLNQLPLTTSQYLDQQPKGQLILYTIRALFMTHNQIHEGPTSNIVGRKDK